MKNVKKTVKKESKSKKESSKKRDFKKENQSLIKQVETLKDEKLRVIADLENFRKRKGSEISSLLKYSGEDLIKKIIPVFDDLDRVLMKSSEIEDKKDLIDGIEMIANKLYKILDSLNISRFDSLGESFDPEYHDAMMTKKAKQKKNIIIEEFEKGYRYHDKIIKHAKVIVSEGS